MTGALAAPATQVLAFVLGCALIHAARAHADLLTRVLVAAALVAAVLVLLGESLAWGPDEPDALDAVSVSGAA